LITTAVICRDLPRFAVHCLALPYMRDLSGSVALLVPTCSGSVAAWLLVDGVKLEGQQLHCHAITCELR
jgi:hypothetical protein